MVASIVDPLRCASRWESMTGRLLCRALNSEVRVVANLRAHSAVWGLSTRSGVLTDSTEGATLELHRPKCEVPESPSQSGAQNHRRDSRSSRSPPTNEGASAVFGVGAREPNPLSFQLFAPKVAFSLVDCQGDLRTTRRPPHATDGRQQYAV